MLVLPTPWHSGRQLVPLLHLTLPLLGFSHNKPPGPETRRPRSISAAHHKHNSTASPLCCSSFLPLSCPLPQRLGRAVRVPTSPPSFLLHLQPIPAAPNHGGNGSAPSQPRRGGAHAHAAAPAPAPARLPRLLLSVRPASAAAARGVGRARDEGRGGEDGRGDHREVRARVRPLVFSSKDDEEGGGERKKSRTDQAKELLAKYGGAYLATSISLSIVSFTLCYLLISAGVDVQDLLAKVGIVTGETGGKVGTFALAYAAHKAASPIRFPPTVALTPVVASWIGKIRKGGD
ncbi:protein FAM210B isoform X1 [Sorghum bicolor]|uniref:protein FAM210B isoform X1 n=1 Tax=Sorghum bicolor TaxID=4558 RepID=UPI000B423EC5|nr:protein FAM210B isoform X1 [Sorghum bicolor]XP_021319037.1 protein FAM210B isoform X1 [Sorghum bicolor]XP_021319038.1 protein FAM210B isoform X1 [Sorghum bicolor]|eukprot:XP_021319036.1 protein FAM210B isoform X1 [Sorghum bicolor]